MTAPRVSVVVPAYNAEKYISKTIESVISQTMEDWEMIVIDDASNDDTCVVVERFCERDSRIVLVRNAENIGVAATRNKGFALARGSWIALLDSDDVWEESKLLDQLDVAEKTGADIVYCSYSIVDESDVKICDDFLVRPTACFESLLEDRVISCSTALLSREITQKYEFPTNRPHEDYVLWLTLLKDGYKACGCCDVLASYRIHKGSRSSNKLKNAMDIWGVYRGEFGLPMGKCTSLLINYAFGGLRKYRRK